MSQKGTEEIETAVTGSLMGQVSSSWQTQGFKGIDGIPFLNWMVGTSVIVLLFYYSLV